MSIVLREFERVFRGEASAMEAPTSPEKERLLAYRCADWAVRFAAAAALRATGFADAATELEGLAEIATADGATAARRRIGVVKSALTRRLGFKIGKSVQSVSDPDFVRYQNSPVARSVMCASWSVAAARKADGPAEPAEEDDAAEEATQSECLMAAAVYAARAGLCAAEAVGRSSTAPDLDAFLLALRASIDA